MGLVSAWWEFLVALNGGGRPSCTLVGGELRVQLHHGIVLWWVLENDADDPDPPHGVLDRTPGRYDLAHRSCWSTIEWCTVAVAARRVPLDRLDHEVNALHDAIEEALSGLAAWFWTTAAAALEALPAGLTEEPAP